VTSSRQKYRHRRRQANATPTRDNTTPNWVSVLRVVTRAIITILPDVSRLVNEWLAGRLAW
jgi:hypothetical protein